MLTHAPMTPSRAAIDSRRASRVRMAVAIVSVGSVLAGCDMLWGTAAAGLGGLVDPGTPVAAHIRANMVRAGGPSEGVTEARLLAKTPGHRVITAAQQDIQITVTADGFKPIVKQFPPTATDAQVQVPAGPRRRFEVDYFGTQQELLGQGQATADLVGGNTLVPVDIFPGIPGLVVQGVSGLPATLLVDVNNAASFTVINQRTDSLTNIQGSLRFLDLKGTDRTSDFSITDSAPPVPLATGASTVISVSAMLTSPAPFRVVHVQPVVRGTLNTGQIFIKRSGDVPPVAVTEGALTFNRTPLTVGLDDLEQVAVADINHDGLLDLVMADWTCGCVVVFPGIGNGSFGQPSSFDVGVNPRGVAVADLNGDGFPDVVTGNHGSDTVSVLFGGSSPLLGKAVDYPVGSEPSGVVIADFNRDGLPDVAVSNFCQGGPSVVSVLLNQGNGALGQATDVAVGSGALSIATADIDGDGVPDLAVANQNSNTVSILLGAGDGTFPRVIPLAVQPSPIAVSLGDLNGDGHVDLVVVSSSAPVEVFLGTGTGGFLPCKTYPAGSDPRFATIADVNNDGIPDLVVGDATGAVQILLGIGDGTFLAPQAIALPNFGFFTSVADLNGDGKPDVVVTSRSMGQAFVLLQTTPLPPPPPPR